MSSLLVSANEKTYFSTVSLLEATFWRKDPFPRVAVCVCVRREQSNQLGCRGNKEGESIGHAMEPRCCHLSRRFSDSNHSSCSMRQQIGKWLFVSNTSALIHWGILFPLTPKVKYPLFFSHTEGLCVCVCMCVYDVCSYLLQLVIVKKSRCTDILSATFLWLSSTAPSIYFSNLVCLCKFLLCPFASILSFNYLNHNFGRCLVHPSNEYFSKYAFHYHIIISHFYS